MIDRFLKELGARLIGHDPTPKFTPILASFNETLDLAVHGMSNPYFNSVYVGNELIPIDGSVNQLFQALYRNRKYLIEVKSPESELIYVLMGFSDEQTTRAGPIKTVRLYNESHLQVDSTEDSILVAHLNNKMTNRNWNKIK